MNGGAPNWKRGDIEFGQRDPIIGRLMAAGLRYSCEGAQRERAEEEDDRERETGEGRR